MKGLWTKLKDRRYLWIDVLVCLSIFFVAMPYVKNFNMPYLDTDEVGYWGGASFFAGYDWSSVISTNGYFSYGYGLILSLLMRIIKKPILYFKCTLLLNIVFLCVLYLVLEKIVVLINCDLNIRTKLCCWAATMYCAEIVYVGMSLPECLLALLFAINVYLLIMFSKKPSWMLAIFIMLNSIYMYTVHQRTVVFIIENIIFALLFILFNKKKLTYKRYVIYGIVFSLICIFLIVLTFILKDTIQKKVWIKTTDTVMINDYSGQVGKIKYFFSLEGFFSFLYMFMGRIFYLITSTYGMLLVFVINGIKCIFNQKELFVRRFLYLYLIISLIGVIGIGSIFNIESYNTTYLFYGRYSENIMPVIVLIIFLYANNIQAKEIFVSFIIAIVIGMAFYYKVNEMAMIDAKYISNTSISHIAISKFYANGKLDLMLDVAIIILFLCIVLILNLTKYKRMLFLILATAYVIGSVKTGYSSTSQFFKAEKLTDMEYIVDVAQNVSEKQIAELTVIVNEENVLGKHDKYGKIVQMFNPNARIYLRSSLSDNSEYFVAHANIEVDDIEILYKNGKYVFGRKK